MDEEEETRVENEFGDVEVGGVAGSSASGGTSGIFESLKSRASSRGMSWIFELEDEDEGDEGWSTKPILEELEIDFEDIFRKVIFCAFPFGKNPNTAARLEEPDFWGPLFIILLYCGFIIWGQLRVLLWVVLLWLVGSWIVYFIVRALGAEKGSYQVTLGLIGYSLLPLAVSVLFGKFTSGSLRALFETAGLLYSSAACGYLLVPPELRATKRVLVMYPVMLMYLYLLLLRSGA